MANGDQRTRSLVEALTIALFGLAVAHDITHFADPGVGTPVVAVVIVAIPQYAGLIWLSSVVLGGELLRAARAALIIGSVIFAGFVAAHLLPFSSTSYWGKHPSPVSWLALWLPVAVSLALIIAALRLRRGALQAAHDDLLATPTKTQ